MLEYSTKGGDKMILAVDIGNTNIVIGKYDGDNLVYSTRLMTDAHKSESEYAVNIKSILSLDKNNQDKISGAIISSVVPPLTKNIQNAIKMLYDVDALIVGPGIKTGINLQVDNPAQVGADLICACVGAYSKYQSPALVIDMGTATKIMVVDEKGTFMGPWEREPRGRRFFFFCPDHRIGSNNRYRQYRRCFHCHGTGRSGSFVMDDSCRYHRHGHKTDREFPCCKI